MPTRQEAERHAELARRMRALQDEICEGLLKLEADFGRPELCFHEDAWEREGGGGGRTRVVQGGQGTPESGAPGVLEKGGVNFSEVHGALSEAMRARLPGGGADFYATGVSLVLHPHNPHVPTVHANFRFISRGDRAWFGGGADLTPYYYDAKDEAEFHKVWREACARHPESADYERFAAWCDHYFYLSHRKESRGVGGIFFDELVVDDSNFEQIAAFVFDCGSSFLKSWLPIARRHAGREWTAAQRHWQEIRRGRYAEFNLVYDRGTTFGLRTAGRIESILMSLPPHVQWVYDHRAEPGSPEAQLLERVGRPRVPAPEGVSEHP